MISIVVPIFNAEKTIEECILSILNQTYRDYELILIDDGSTDGSGEICDRYRDINSNIKCLHIVNGGVSNARNRGVEISAGEYIAFVDADDTIEPEYLTTLWTMMESTQADLSVMKDSDNEKFKKYAPCSKYEGYLLFTQKSALISTLTSAYFSGHPWGKLYKRTLIDDLRFDTSIHCCEDLLFVIMYLLKCRKVCYTEKNLYNYMIGTESASRGRLTKSKLTAYDAIEKIKNIMPSEYAEIIPYVDYHATRIVLTLYDMLANSSKDARTAYKNMLVGFFRNISFGAVFRIAEYKIRIKMILLKTSPNLLLMTLKLKR